MNIPKFGNTKPKSWWHPKSWATQICMMSLCVVLKNVVLVQEGRRKRYLVFGLSDYIHIAAEQLEMWKILVNG